MNLHEKKLHALQLIEQYKSNDFVQFFNDNIEDMEKIELPKIYQKACEKGNVVIADFLLNCPLNNRINYDFPYAERTMYEYEIPNGAIFLAFDNHHFDLIEYFLKNNIYHIDSWTEECLDKYMSSATEYLRKIEFKLYLEESTNSKKEPTKNIKI